MRHISYGRMGGLVAVFASGGIALLVAQNILGKESLTFSTTGLISFLFGIALAAASTVLAIASIILGKASEQVMIERSDQSIRLQNEVFVKTTEALARIESSTGVTEKRIEDIISGRAGELSRKIAEQITLEAGGKGPNKGVLEKEIRESLLGELSGRLKPGTEDRDLVRKELLESTKYYRKFQSDVLVAIVNTGSVKVEKIGDGNFDSTSRGNDLFDGVFLHGHLRIAVSSVSTQKRLVTTHIHVFEQFLHAAAGEIKTGAYGRLIIALDGVDPDGEYRKIYDRVTSVLKSEIAKVIDLVDGPDGSAITNVVERIAALNSQPAPTVQA